MIDLDTVVSVFFIMLSILGVIVVFMLMEGNGDESKK